MTGRQILVYAPINITIVDGSSIWLRSVTQMLSMVSDTSVDLLLFANPRGENVGIPGVRHTYCPSSCIFTGSGIQGLETGSVLPPEPAIDAVTILQHLHDYDYLLVRGLDAAYNMAQLPDKRTKLIIYLTDVEHHLLWEKTEDNKTLKKLETVVNAATILLCQTTGLQAIFEELVPQACSKTALLPPMIPDKIFDDGEPDKKKLSDTTKIIYAGKFAPDWGIQDLFSVNDALHHPENGLELHVYGDKIHKEPQEFYLQTKERLDNEDNFVWKGSISRDSLLASLPQYDLGYAFRNVSMNANPEISTKLLEYIALGVAPVLSKSQLHIDYLGEDYPLFITSYDDLKTKLSDVISKKINLRDSLKKGRENVKKHKMGSIAKNIEEVFRYFEPLSSSRPKEARRPSLLLAGHDFKFMGDLKDSLINERHFSIAEAAWPSFQSGGEEATAGPLQTADIAFCEWTLGNAVYCSKHKRDGQCLISRFHRFEILTDFPPQIDIEKMDKVVTVSKHMKRQIVGTYGWPDNKVAIIPNSIDPIKLKKKKTKYAKFNLGIAGILPKLKRFDLCLDLLEHLRAEDDRYTLHVKGKLPWHLLWIWENPEQRKFYQTQLERIRHSPLLKGAVHFYPFGDDVSRWLSNVGWILSLSDIESFHLAAIEGMASGAIPIVKQREGTEDIFSSDKIFTDTASMSSYILSVTDNASLMREESEKSISNVACYDRKDVMLIWKELFEGFGFAL